jgi:ABC-type branched-subunit amino acid transport system ATPase component
VAVLAASNLRKSYGGEEVVAGVTFGIATGECFGLLGPNGAGKTATLRLCLGLVDPDGAIARPLLLGQIPGQAALHALVLLAYAAAGFYASAVLFRRRLLK